MRIASLIGVLGMVVGCAQDASTTSTGNQALGIDRFAVDESSSNVVITGLDTEGAEVARLELVHGVFTLSEMFKDDYATPTVDGRKLSLDVGEQKMRYETAGYEPLMSLPAPRSEDWKIAEFVHDPHVAPILAKWSIGFEVASDDASEGAYHVTGNIYGSSPQTCNGLSTCGTTVRGTINTCGGGGSPSYAARVTQKSGTNCGLYSSSYNEVVVSQCCPAGTGGQSTNWYAEKACPTTTSNSNTRCGTATSVCKACPSYPTVAFSNSCFAATQPTIGSCSGLAVYPLYHDYYTSVQDYCRDHGAFSCDGVTCSYDPCP